MTGNKHFKNQTKILRRIYQKIPRRFGARYFPLRLKREWQHGEDFRVLLCSQ